MSNRSSSPNAVVAVGSSLKSPTLTSPPNTRRVGHPIVNTTMGLKGASSSSSSSSATVKPISSQLSGSKKEITSSSELIQFVDVLLNDLESRFDVMSNDVLSRLSSITTRIDSLETSIGDLMNGTVGDDTIDTPKP